MIYEPVPLYPSLRPEGCDPCVRVPVFGARDGFPGPPGLRCCKRVTLENPCRPGEVAEVLLGVDERGNLVVCVQRDDDCPPHCRPRRRPRPCLPEPELCCRPPRPDYTCCTHVPDRECLPPGPPCDLRPPHPCGHRGRLYGNWG